MQSHLSIQIIASAIDTLTKNELLPLTGLPLNRAEAKRYTMDQGTAISQSISHYLVHIELFECSFSESLTFKITVNAPSFFMFVMLNGSSVFKDGAGNTVSEAAGNCCSLSYIRTGDYARHFAPGKHKMLLLTFREDYFIGRCQAMPEFKPLLDGYQSAEQAYCVLPHCSVAESIFNLLEKRLGSRACCLKTELATLLFIEQCLDKYHHALVAKQYDTNTVHKLKAAALAEFIHEHYAEKIAGDLTVLADKFHISKKMVVRLVKKEFGRSLHEYVIKLRMDAAMAKLLAADKLVKDVAAEVGYPDPHYFSKAFKKHHKISPGEVQRK